MVDRKNSLDELKTDDRDFPQERTMPINTYECLILLDATKTAQGEEAVRGQVMAALEKQGAEVIAARKWDERKLAYPVDGQRKGYYFLTFFKLDSLKLNDIHADYRINENILRFMTQHIPDKWYEEFSAVAIDERRLAYQAMREDDTLGDLEGDDRGSDRRRGRRDDSGKD
jgi:small subunit ribosomal protein S6